MSLNEESANDAASSQIPELRTSERKQKIVKNQTNTAPMTNSIKKKKNTDTGTKHDETKLTRSTPNRAQTMPIQAENNAKMPDQVQNMPIQGQNVQYSHCPKALQLHEQESWDA